MMHIPECVRKKKQPEYSWSFVLDTVDSSTENSCLVTGLQHEGHISLTQTFARHPWLIAHKTPPQLWRRYRGVQEEQLKRKIGQIEIKDDCFFWPEFHFFKKEEFWSKEKPVVWLTPLCFDLSFKLLHVCFTAFFYFFKSPGFCILISSAAAPCRQMIWNEYSKYQLPNVTHAPKTQAYITGIFGNLGLSTGI